MVLGWTGPHLALRACCALEAVEKELLPHHSPVPLLLAGYQESLEDLRLLRGRQERSCHVAQLVLVDIEAAVERGRRTERGLELAICCVSLSVPSAAGGHSVAQPTTGG